MLQRGKETFDFVQEIAIGQNFDHVRTVKFAVSLAQRALHAIIFFGHGFLGGKQDFSDPVHLLTADYTRTARKWQ